MASKEETAAIRRFVREQLSRDPDLSELTLGILRKRYLTHAGCDSLSPEVKQKFKQVVEEELIRMQDNDKGESESKTKEPQKKRKREKQSEEFPCESGDEVNVKKSRPNNSSSSSEPEDNEDSEAGSEEGEDEEQNKSGSNKKKQDSLKPQPEENKRSKEMSSKDSSDDEIINDSDEGQTVTPRKEAKINSGSEESISEADAKSEKGDTNSDSSDDRDNEGKKAATKKSNDSDSDSSQITSDDDKPVKKEEKTTKKNGAKKEGRQPSKGEKAVNRLKHYITLCGARKNYKKLFEGCKSVSSQLNILRKVLEDLGVHGNPSIKKCKKAKKKLERAQELADLDLSNIITTKGRPKRGGAWQKQADPLPSTYQRAMNSGSDSDQEDNGTRRRRRVTEWDNLRGIISDDGDSD
ncbi:HIRA-interacting protein 3 [Gouania willdenowi]|uniref:Histone chaperone domain-containing protein n=1 Tax=Gouania willdenowi TaxID=441366 RepID=A0A8C5EZH8_GOUWI|nr:HIRA-interacting protein 3 [Gouania willdenowi]